MEICTLDDAKELEL